MEKVFCPVNGWDCPYFLADGECVIDDPLNNCDDYAAMEECLNDDSNEKIWFFGGAGPEILEGLTKR